MSGTAISNEGGRTTISNGSGTAISNEVYGLIANHNKAREDIEEQKKRHTSLEFELCEARERAQREHDKKMAEIDADYSAKLTELRKGIKDNYEIVADSIRYPPDHEFCEAVVAAGFNKDEGNFTIAYHGKLCTESIIDSRLPEGNLSAVTLVHIANYGYVRYYTSKCYEHLDDMTTQYVIADSGAIYTGKGNPDMLTSEEGKAFIQEAFNEMCGAMFAKFT